MDRYYVSIPDPTPPPEGFQPFRKDQFAELVRSILCGFYDDGEILVANFLLESDIAYTDQQIAEALSLPQRQVRAILEARLCKDFITEAEVPNMGSQGAGAQAILYAGGASAWYRISPNILSATWYRLTQTERKMLDRLKSVQETESYVCLRCGGREFDSLRAVSLFSQADGLFHCDICEDILQMRQNKQLREKIESLLVQFRNQFEHMKERLESMNKMFVPRPIVIKKTVHEKLLEQARENGSSTGGIDRSRADFSQLSAALNASISSSSLNARSAPAAAPEWIREAQLITNGQTIERPPEEALALEAPTGRGPKRSRVEEITIATCSRPQDVKTIIESASSMTKKEEIVEKKSEVVFVTVGGTQYELEEVRANEALIEMMSDEEYTQFDALLQSIGFR